MKTDWFELKEARLQLAPTPIRLPDRLRQHHHTLGHARGRQARSGLLSLGAGLPGGPVDGQAMGRRRAERR